MAITAENPWTGSIYFDDEIGSRLSGPDLPIPRVLQELSLHDIAYAFADQPDDHLGNRPKAQAWDASSLVVQKTPGTRLSLASSVVRVETPPPGSGFFKSVTYQLPESSDPPIQVIHV